jgi:tRNA pseudouridine38-40 synthase
VRLRLDVAYDGTEFSGWAAQPGRRTVQGVLQDALATILRMPFDRLTVAGRTDAGVHARGQVCHLDVPLDELDVERLMRRLNRLLAADLAVRGVHVVPDDFDARFGATWRRYAYRIRDDASTADPVRRREELSWPRRLDEKTMDVAGALLVGEHDFAAYCKRREGASTVRSLRALTCSRDDGLVTFRVVSDSFCHNMVRSLVGSLVVVGEGRRPAEWPLEVLRGAVRDSRVPVLPPGGLTLEEVGYSGGWVDDATI